MYYNYFQNYRQSNYNTAGAPKTKKVEAAAVNNNAAKTSFCAATNPIINEIPYDKAKTASPLRTRLTGKDEIDKYNTVLKNCDKDTKKHIDALLKGGILLNNDSNDKTSVLDNLYKIATTPRAQGLNNQSILKDTVEALLNPYIINQQFGDIPANYSEGAVDAYLGTEKNDPSKRAQAKQDINVPYSGTCVAASIEFNLAKKHPAEYARFANGLSSPEMAVDKEISLKNLTEKSLDAVWLLNAFEIPHKTKGFDKTVLKIAPDKNAIVRAQIQTTNRDAGERSSVDVLMQSAFMNVGSQQTYNSLSDKRSGKFNSNDKGLIEFEKTFTESIVEDKNKMSVTYQKVDDNGHLVGYETDFNTIKKQISDAIKAGENVIIGYTEVDEHNEIIGGHEITITDIKTDKNGKMIFVCNDTDDGISKPIEYSEDYLVPKIHHAALPQEIVQNDIQITDNWVEGLKSYKEMKMAA
ncbi:hypothetical protein J6E39_07020 [bacterium]|nr:hypothetical protein [bacterium]